MNLKQIGVVVGSLCMVMIAFQNCAPSKKNSFAADAAALKSLSGEDGPAADIYRPQPSEDTPTSDIYTPEPDQRPLANSVVGNYNVLSINSSVCKNNICSGEAHIMKSKQTLSFAANGVLSGVAACNKFGGKYSATLRPNEGTHLLSVSLGASSQASCTHIKDEQLLLTVLAHAYKISNTAAAIVDIYSYNAATQESGSIRLQRHNVPVVPVRSVLSGVYRVIGTSKNLCSSNMANISGPCVIHSQNFKSKQSLNFQAKGILSGQGACNAFGGSYQYTVRANEGTDLLSISNLQSTLKACAYLGEEQELFKALSQVYKVQYSVLNKVQTVHLYLSSGGTLILQK